MTGAGPVARLEAAPGEPGSRGKVAWERGRSVNRPEGESWIVGVDVGGTFTDF